MRAAWSTQFSSIRWKMTGAFMLVALVLAFALLVVFLGVLLFFLYSSFLPNALGDSARQYAAAVADETADPTGDPNELIERLRRFSAAQTSPPAPQGAQNSDITLETQVSDEELLIALIDTQGRVITTTHPLEYGAGLQLGELEPTPADTLVRRALSGITATVQLSAWSEPDHQPIAVAPVFGPNGQISGALYLRLVNFPAAGIFLGNLTPFLITFLLPWVMVSGGLGSLFALIVGRGFVRRITRLTAASAALASGDLARRVEDPSGDEIGQLGRQFNTMADQIGEGIRSLRVLADKNAQLAEQAAALAAVEERNRIARELHDSVSQELFSLTMLAAAARRTLAMRPEATAARLEEIEDSARRALEETRGLIFALRPAALDNRGLAPALRELAGALRERQGLAVDMRITGERRLPLEYEQALFRIVQEALANVARHSGVRAAEVELCYRDDRVALEVRDSGRGFDPQAARNPSAIGLHSIAERAEALGGDLKLRSALGVGATIAVSIPLPALAV